MKKLLIISLLLASVLVNAQIPYFGGINSKDKPTYSYTSLKIDYKVNTYGQYTTFLRTFINKEVESGFNPSLAVYTDMYSYKGGHDIGIGLRTNIFKSNHFNLGIESGALFNTFDNLKYSYLVSGLFINGMIVNKLGYVYNGWMTNYKGIDKPEFSHWLYLAYFMNCGLNPMVGATYDSNKINPAIGVYYNFSNSNIYLWYGNKSLITIGIDFTF